MFQSMMSQIKEESVGYLYNLEVEVRRAGADQTEVEAKGLVDQQADHKLQYSAPNDSGDVEVRNERGQVQQAATARLRKATAAPQQAEPAARGAFGQRTDAEQALPANREQRRAQSRKRR